MQTAPYVFVTNYGLHVGSGKYVAAVTAVDLLVSKTQRQANIRYEYSSLIYFVATQISYMKFVIAVLIKSSEHFIFYIDIRYFNRYEVPILAAKH